MLAQHVQAVHLRQAKIQDHAVELMVGQRRVGLGAGVHLVGGVAGRAQRAQQAVGQHLIVFGNENAHGLSPLAARVVGGPSTPILGSRGAATMHAA
jgi:hypothetical protein